MKDHIQTEDDVFAINDGDDHFGNDEDEDDFGNDEDEDDFGSDYNDDIEPGPERPRYPKAAPMLAFSSRVSAYKYAKHIERFRKKFGNLCITRFKNDRAHYRLMCARLGDEYFVIQVHCAKHHMPEPSPVESYGMIQYLPSVPPHLVVKAELFYADEKKLAEKYTAFRNAILDRGDSPIIGLGEKFYCSNLSMSISPYGGKADIELVYPYDYQHEVHSRLRATEAGHKTAFAKYTTVEKQIVDHRAFLEATRQLMLHVSTFEEGKAK